MVTIDHVILYLSGCKDKADIFALRPLHFDVFMEVHFLLTQIVSNLVSFHRR
jgi:hypothetical protein